MTVITKKDLWEFVNRADDPEKIEIAREWLKNNEHAINGLGDNELLEDLYGALFVQQVLLFDEVNAGDTGETWKITAGNIRKTKL